ncbi:hypothetical protein BO78DRAFT_98149 [Aspergillus sclerotiicarbonarius CBS 121057]|uniref:Uncharacterized protein n=1 Tax=Aspergillus sclerotiicarbonarius (strain CBS 121057 / IBT 28362) TaxID=1448318 RepID=A0A319EMP0_ASPSB|nr:hypothetical protein BO78DRAFT_98149 [Aspergillus sclerotiicarbonarius CBS 121057]
MSHLSSPSMHVYRFCCCPESESFDRNPTDLLSLSILEPGYVANRYSFFIAVTSLACSAMLLCYAVLPMVTTTKIETQTFRNYIRSDQTKSLSLSTETPVRSEYLHRCEVDRTECTEPRTKPK